jgi:hypothetical protein
MAVVLGYALSMNALPGGPAPHETIDASANPLKRTGGGHNSMSRSPRRSPMGLFHRRHGGDSDSRRLWCRHTGLAPAHGHHVSTRYGLQTPPGMGRGKHIRTRFEGSCAS